MTNKLYPCIECGRMVKIRSKKKCPACRNKERRQEGSLPVYTNKLKSGQKETARDSTKSDFFAKHIELLRNRPYSDHSGNSINNPASLHIAHILPKRKGGGFPSIATEDQNVVYLTWGEHTLFDQLLNQRDFKKLEAELTNIWEIVCRRLPNLLSLASENNKLRTDLENYLDGRNR